MNMESVGQKIDTYVYDAVARLIDKQVTYPARSFLNKIWTVDRIPDSLLLTVVEEHRRKSCDAYKKYSQCKSFQPCETRLKMLAYKAIDYR